MCRIARFLRPRKSELTRPEINGHQWDKWWVGLRYRPTYRRRRRPIKVTKQNYKVYNKYNITPVFSVFSVLALLFCLSGRIFASASGLDKIRATSTKYYAENTWKYCLYIFSLTNQINVRLLSRGDLSVTFHTAVNNISQVDL